MEIPIIVLTAEDNLSRVRKDMPDAEVLGKPFDIDDLLAKIEAHRVPCETVRHPVAPSPQPQRVTGRGVLVLTLLVAFLRLMWRFVPVRWLLGAARRTTSFLVGLLSRLVRLVLAPVRAARWFRIGSPTPVRRNELTPGLWRA
jgi:hypothetical protein